MGHDHERGPAPDRPTLLTSAAGFRLVGAAFAVVVLWLAVWWAAR